MVRDLTFMPSTVLLKMSYYCYTSKLASSVAVCVCVPTHACAQVSMHVCMLLYVYKYFAYMYECVQHECLVPAPSEVQKRAPDPLELELQMVVSHSVGAGS